MITDFQFKLFINDPKFKDVPLNNKNSQQIAIQKVYTGQKQLHRKNVITDSIQKKSNPTLSKPNLQIDFIESRMHSFEMMLVQDIGKLFEDVQRIKGAYQSRIEIQTKIDHKLKDIGEKIVAVENQVGGTDQQQLKIVERAVRQIQLLFEENKRLKNQNALIADKIQKKKISRKNANPGTTSSHKTQLQQRNKYPH